MCKICCFVAAGGCPARLDVFHKYADFTLVSKSNNSTSRVYVLCKTWELIIRIADLAITGKKCTEIKKGTWRARKAFVFVYKMCKICTHFIYAFICAAVHNNLLARVKKSNTRLRGQNRLRNVETTAIWKAAKNTARISYTYKSCYNSCCF